MGQANEGPANPTNDGLEKLGPTALLVADLAGNGLDLEATNTG